MRLVKILYILLIFMSFGGKPLNAHAPRCDYDLLDDNALVDIIASSDHRAAERAFESLWSRLKGPSTGYIVNLLKKSNEGAHVIEEIVSDTMLNTWTTLAKGNFKKEEAGPGGVRGYVMRVAYSQVALYFRPGKVKKRNANTTLDIELDDGTTLERNFSIHADPMAQTLPPESLPGISRFNAEAVKQIIEEALQEAEMSQKSRQVLGMQILKNLSFIEIAEILSSPYHTVRADWKEGLLKLRIHLKENGYILEDLLAGDIKKSPVSQRKVHLSSKTRNYPNKDLQLSAQELLRIRDEVLKAYKIAELTPRMRNVFKMKVFEGNSYLEIAKVLNSSEGNIRQSFYDAAEKIEILLKNENIRYEELILLDFSETLPSLSESDYGEKPNEELLKPDLFLANVVEAIKLTDMLPRMRKIVILRLFYHWGNPDIMRAFNLKTTAASAAFQKSLEKMSYFLTDKGISLSDLQNAKFNLSTKEITDLFSDGRGKAGKLKPQEFREKIEDALENSKLTDRQSKVSRLYMFEHLSASEIALKLNLTSPRVSSEFIEARAKMSRYLEEYEITADDLSNVDFTLPELEWNPTRYTFHIENTKINFKSREEKLELIINSSDLSERTALILKLHTIYRWCFRNIAEALNLNIESVQAYINNAVDKLSIELSKAELNVIELKSDDNCFEYKAGRREPILIPNSLKNLANLEVQKFNLDDFRKKILQALEASKTSKLRKELLRLRIMDGLSNADLAQRYKVLPSSIRSHILRATMTMSPELEKLGISREQIDSYLNKH